MYIQLFRMALDGFVYVLVVVVFYALLEWMVQCFSEVKEIEE